jgi:hypothetical protein
VPEALNTVNGDAEPSGTEPALAKPATDKAKPVRQVLNSLFFIMVIQLIPYTFEQLGIIFK